jgi:hypothetical protein
LPRELTESHFSKNGAFQRMRSHKNIRDTSGAIILSF